LGVTTSSRTTFDTECWALGWLTDTGEGSFFEVSSEGLAKTDGGGGFAFTEGCWGDTNMVILF
jgi:hypothetical protein